MQIDGYIFWPRNQFSSKIDFDVCSPCLLLFRSHMWVALLHYLEVILTRFRIFTMCPPLFYCRVYTAHLVW